MIKELKVYFVVETDAATKTDDAYYTWILKNFYPEITSAKGLNGIRLSFDFIHMNGKMNYRSRKIDEKIKSFKRMRKENIYFVFCFDLDSTSNQDKNFLKNVDAFCRERDYFLIMSYREIESVLKVKHKTLSKSDRVKEFNRKQPKKDTINVRDLRVKISDLGKIDGESNICLVIDELCKKAS